MLLVGTLAFLLIELDFLRHLCLLGDLGLNCFLVDGISLLTILLKLVKSLLKLFSAHELLLLPCRQLRHLLAHLLLHSREFFDMTSKLLVLEVPIGDVFAAL